MATDNLIKKVEEKSFEEINKIRARMRKVSEICSSVITYLEKEGCEYVVLLGKEDSQVTKDVFDSLLIPSFRYKLCGKGYWIGEMKEGVKYSKLILLKDPINNEKLNELNLWSPNFIIDN